MFARRAVVLLEESAVTVTVVVHIGGARPRRCSGSCSFLCHLKACVCVRTEDVSGVGKLVARDNRIIS